jgi:hypothetical protein
MEYSLHSYEYLQSSREFVKQNFVTGMLSPYSNSPNVVIERWTQWRSKYMECLEVFFLTSIQFLTNYAWSIFYKMTVTGMVMKLWSYFRCINADWFCTEAVSLPSKENINITTTVCKIFTIAGNKYDQSSG